MQVMRQRLRYRRKKMADRPSHDPISSTARGRSRHAASRDVHVGKLCEVQSEVRIFPLNQAE